MDLIEQQATAERDLARARQDREAEKQRVGSLGNEIAPGFVMTANGLTRTQGLRSGATAGIEGEKQQLQERAGSLLQRFNVQQLLQEQFGRTSPPELARAQAAARMRELRDQLTSPGGAEGVISEFGGRLGRGFSREAGQIGAQALNIQGREATLSEEEARTGLQRKREDLDQPVKDATQRLIELQDKLKEVQMSYTESIKTLNDDFDSQVRESSRTLEKLGEEARKLTESFQQNGLALAKNLAPIIQGLTGLTKPGAGGKAAAAALAPTSQIVFGPGSVNINSNDPKQFIRWIEEQQRVARAR